MDALDEASAGGRVTRSLRKRLTSVDSEASVSRPNTPIGTKLNSINEQSSPPRLTRMTRRNSVVSLAGTPAKTPSKTVSRIDTTSEFNSPMRRVNRHRSISITEDEETTTSVKPVIKIEALPEDESITSKRVTRSASKSPLQLITNGENLENSMSKLGGKPKRAAKAEPEPVFKAKPVARTTNQEQESDSDVEIIDLESEDEENVQANVTSNKNNGFGGNKSGNAVGKTPGKNSRKTHQKPPQKTIAKNKITDKIEKSPTKTKNTKTNITETKMEAKNQSIRETVINETVKENENTIEGENTSETFTKSKPVYIELPEIAIGAHDQEVASAQLTSPKYNHNNTAIVTEVVNLKCFSPEQIHKVIGFPKQSPTLKRNTMQKELETVGFNAYIGDDSAKISFPKTTSPTLKNNNIQEKLKAVTFNDSIEDDASKSSYPKTPGLTKSKSYIELDSSREAEKNNSFQSVCISKRIEVDQGILKEEHNQTEQKVATQTPIKSIAKFKTMQSSTPLLNGTTLSSTEADPNTTSDEKEFIQLDEVVASPLKSSKNSPISRRKLLVDSPSSTSVTMIPIKSPTKTKKSDYLMEEMEAVPLDTTILSELLQKSSEKLSACPKKLLEKTSENSPRRSPRIETLNKLQSVEPALRKSLAIEEEESDKKSDCSEHMQMSKRSLRSLERTREISIDGPLQSPKEMALRNSPQQMQSPNKSMSSKREVKMVEKSSEIMQPDDDSSSTHFLTEFHKESPRAAPTFTASSWTPSVSGISNNSKIDRILAEKEKTPNSESELINDVHQVLSPHHRSRFESDDDDDISFEDYVEAKSDEELAENEKPHQEHEFISDEAMEVNDYQSGESMDSEERREIENNEITCDGESIGSEDTDDNEDDENEDEENEDEENASFIDDDSKEESLADYSEDNEKIEHLLEVERKNRKNLKKKSYRRILTVDDDDSDASKDNDADEIEKIEATKDNDDADEDIGTLIESIGQIVNEIDNSEDNDSSGDKDGVVEKNAAEISRSGALSRSKTFNVTSVAKNVAAKPARCESQNENNNVSLKEKSTSRNIAKSTENPTEEKASKHPKIFHKTEKQNEDHEDEDLEDKDEDHTVGDGDAEDHEAEDYKVRDCDAENHVAEDNVAEVQKDEDKGQPNENEDYKKDNERNDNFNSSKLSETTLRLEIFDTNEESSTDQEKNYAMVKKEGQNFNASRKKIIKYLQQSERFNKTVHDFRLEKSGEENCFAKTDETTDNTNVDSKNRRKVASMGNSRIIEQRRLHRLLSNQQQKAATDDCSETSSSISGEDESRQSTEKQMYKTLQRYSLKRNQENTNKQKANSPNKKQTEIIKRRSSKTQEKKNGDEKIERNASNGDGDSDTDSDTSNDEKHHQLEKSTTKKKHNKSSAALSVSLSYIKERPHERTSSINTHSSFTIGVVVGKNGKNQGVPLEPICNPFGVDAEDSASDTETEVAKFSSAEEEQLEKLEHTKNLPSVGLNSSAVYNKQTSEALTEFKNSSKQRRTICIPADYGDFTTSQSFIESVSVESKDEFAGSQASTKRKRLSKSFCAGASLDTTELEEVQHLNKKSKLACNEIAINSSTPFEQKKIEKKKMGEDKIEQSNSEKMAIAEKKKTNTKNDDVNQRILSRCEEMLEAANRAKLEAKLNSNKSKVKLLKKKKSKKLAEVQQQHHYQLQLKEGNKEKIKQNEVKIAKKQLKRQDKVKLEIEKALKASANIILNKPEKKVNQNMAKQQLPKTVLDGLCNEDPAASKEITNKNSKVDKTILKTSAGEVLETRLVEKKKNKIPSTEEIQLSTGTVRVEPATPTKQLIRSGFRESPMTPLSLGFKVRHILSAGQDTPTIIPTKVRKRKRSVIEEPRHTLPKPQWTQSGVFIEEDIYATAPITTVGSTKFSVSALNGVRKKKKNKLAKAGGAAVARTCSSSIVNSSALQFKKNALFRDDIRRETSRELLQRKQRKHF